jgi:hypothetical protein
VFEHVPHTDHQRIRMFGCGPGWATVRLPSQVERLDALADAVDRIEAVAVDD